jgi:hypothetical protein
MSEEGVSKSQFASQMLALGLGNQTWNCKCGIGGPCTWSAGSWDLGLTLRSPNLGEGRWPFRGGTPPLQIMIPSHREQRDLQGPLARLGSR